MKEWQGLPVSLAGKLVVAGGLIGMLGMGAGAWVFGARPVEAQQQAPQVNWRECFNAVQPSVEVSNQSVVDAPSPERTVRIPNGWVVVGGGDGTILLCRP